MRYEWSDEEEFLLLTSSPNQLTPQTSTFQDSDTNSLHSHSCPPCDKTLLKLFCNHAQQYNMLTLMAASRKIRLSILYLLVYPDPTLSYHGPSQRMNTV